MFRCVDAEDIFVNLTTLCDILFGCPAANFAPDIYCSSLPIYFL